MKRNVFGWFLSLAAGIGLLTVTPVFSQQKGDEPGRVNASKQVQPVNNQGEPRDINDQLRAEGVQPGAAGGTTRVQAAPGTARAPGAAPAGARAARSESTQQQLDSDIASCLILANQNEVALAKLAASKSQNDDVKKFADKLERDHSAMLAKLQKFTSHNFTDRDTSRDTSSTGAAPRENVRSEVRAENRETRETIREERAENRENKAETRREAQPARAGGAPGTTRTEGNTVVHEAAAGAHDHELIAAHRQIKHELADQCLADAKKELSSKNSNEFDECFVGMQIAGHMHMITELKVTEKHVSANLREVLTSGQQTSEEHLKEAKDLIKKLTRNDSK